MPNSQAIAELGVIVVDDEPLARQGLTLRLAEFPHVKVLTECRNADEAIEAIREHEPDVAFLDINMPGTSGLTLVEQLAAQFDEDARPLFVFVTAYKRYSLDAFELDTLDYLMKPVSVSRLEKTFGRVESALEARQVKLNQRRLLEKLSVITGKSGEELQQLLNSELDPDSGTQKLAIRDAGRETLYIPYENIEWFEAAGDYICVHTNKSTEIMRSTMKDLDTKLNPTVFRRIHRSVIVNVDRIEKALPHTHGEMFLILKNGKQLKVSRSYKARIKQFL